MEQWSQKGKFIKLRCNGTSQVTFSFQNKNEEKRNFKMNKKLDETDEFFFL